MLGNSKRKYTYRIKNKDRTFLNTRTGFNSWFILKEARKIVNTKMGQIIVESDRMNIL